MTIKAENYVKDGENGVMFWKETKSITTMEQAIAQNECWFCEYGSHASGAEMLKKAEKILK
ncbi:hypothetical protein [Thioclava sp. DLFJ4-1]|uniref:hypothetical protein n=1 Tax=Thioclava sp. DLFJ4-1 TaxID=1915313 RepID=UPI000996C873|nr:hypothetical protein [Thioclava sp. DLFJ4-1]OOY15069.1 hypothetical protein BMI85_16100 [Thioclava sp. DLFJ4-1]